MSRILMFVCCLFAAAAMFGCSVQEYRLVETDPEQKVVRECEAKASSFLRMAEIESLQGKISCDKNTVSEFGATGLKAKGDAEFVRAAAEGAASGASRAAGK